MRKPRSDSKLDALDLDQQRQLCEWLLTPGLSYKLIVKQVFEEFNVSTSGAALSAFYQSYCGPYLLQRRREAVGLAEEVAQEAKKTPGQWDAATIDALQQKAFELANNPMVNPDAVKGVFALVLKAREQDLKKANLDLEHQKFRRTTCELFLKWYDDKRVQEIVTGGGTHGERIEALGRALFPDDWDEA